MSRAYEALLRNQLARLSRWIADSELLASQSNDEDTLRHVEADLARWRESRDQCRAVLRRTKLLNRFVSWTLVTFLLSFVLLLIAGMLANGTQIDERLSSFLFIGADLLLVIGSGVMYLFAITFRDAAARGHRPWSFSVRSLLIMTTIFAIVLGCWFYIRH